MAGSERSLGLNTIVPTMQCMNDIHVWNSIIQCSCTYYFQLMLRAYQGRTYKLCPNNDTAQSSCQTQTNPLNMQEFAKMSGVLALSSGAGEKLYMSSAVQVVIDVQESVNAHKHKDMANYPSPLSSFRGQLAGSGLSSQFL